MKLELGTIKHLQEYIATKIKERGFKDESIHERMILLTEEVGELAKAVRKTTNMYVSGKNPENYGHAGEEAADVLNMLFSIVIALNIDFEKEFINKEAKNDERTYRRPSQANT